jgi:hypothetical protein
MDIVNRLSAIEEIIRLKARYFRCLDTKDWSGLEALFSPDAVFDMRSGRGTSLDPEAIIHGAVAIRQFVSDAVAALVTVHHGHTPEIDVLDADHARAVWPMHDVLVVPDGVQAPFRRFEGYGHYHETYERRDGHWLVGADRKLSHF